LEAVNLLQIFFNGVRGLEPGLLLYLPSHHEEFPAKSCHGRKAGTRQLERAEYPPFSLSAGDAMAWSDFCKFLSNMSTLHIYAGKDNFV
jgi:hypothetical protein